jgi:hypothetical protein
MHSVDHRDHCLEQIRQYIMCTGVSGTTTFQESLANEEGLDADPDEVLLRVGSKLRRFGLSCSYMSKL